jgi:DNA-binding XRE family transcriptional regulator
VRDDGGYGQQSSTAPQAEADPLHLRGWRKFRELSQAELGERIGVSDATISRIEKGEQNWDQEFLKAAAEVLRCDPVDLLMRDPSQPGAVWSIWAHAKPADRVRIDNVVVALVGGSTGTEG